MSRLCFTRLRQLPSLGSTLSIDMSTKKHQLHHYTQSFLVGFGVVAICFVAVAAIAVSLLQRHGGQFAPTAPESRPAAAENICTLGFTALPAITPSPTATPSIEPTASPTALPTASPTTSPTATPVIGGTSPTPIPLATCNQYCELNSDCENLDHICYDPDPSNGLTSDYRCRRYDNLDDTSCTDPNQYNTEIAFQTLDEPGLPNSGNTSNTPYLVVATGVVVLILGALGLLLLL